MTREQWIALKVGDVIVQTRNGIEREVTHVSRVSGQRGQRGKTRTMIRLKKIRGRGEATICNAEDKDGERWRLK